MKLLATFGLIAVVVGAGLRSAPAAATDLAETVRTAAETVDDALAGAHRGRTARLMRKAGKLLGAWSGPGSAAALKKLARAVRFLEKAGGTMRPVADDLVAGLGALADERETGVAGALANAAGKAHAKGAKLLAKARNIRRGAPASGAKAAMALARSLGVLGKAVAIVGSSSRGGDQEKKGRLVTTPGATWRNVIGAGDRFVEEADPAGIEQLAMRAWGILSGHSQWVAGSFYWWFNLCELYPGDGQNPCFTYGGIDSHSGYVYLRKIGEYYGVDGSGPFLFASVTTWDSGAEYVVFLDETHFAYAKPTPDGTGMMSTVYTAR